MEGILLRPMLRLNTEGCEGKKSIDLLDFGLCHINNFNQKIIYLSNVSKIPAKWKLTYVKYIPKKVIAPATITKLEVEEANKTDDPAVFEFSLTEVKLRGWLRLVCVYKF